jgi:peroxiredoxin
MAQLRHDYDKFKAADTDVLVIVPNGRKMIEKHVQEHHPPYRILSDKGGAVAKQYGIEPKALPFLTAFKPAVFLVGKSGKVLYPTTPLPMLRSRTTGSHSRCWLGRRSSERSAGVYTAMQGQS